VCLVHLDGSIDLADKPEAREESNGSGQDEKSDGGHGHVREVEHCGHEAFDLELGVEIPHGVEEEVAARGACREEGAPPPAVVFVAELEVAHHDRDLSAGDDEDDQDGEQESEHEVDLHRDKERDETSGGGGERGKQVTKGKTWWSHIAVIMKKSSIQTAPKGKMPPKATEKYGLVYQAWSGMWREI
jgi:hypothetical protein